MREHKQMSVNISMVVICKKWVGKVLASGDIPQIIDR